MDDTGVPSKQGRDDETNQDVDDLRDLEQSKDILAQLLESVSGISDSLGELKTRAKKESGDIDKMLDTLSQMTIAARSVSTMIGKVEKHRIKAVESGDGLNHRINQLELELQNNLEITEEIAGQNAQLGK
jgi:methyl-accepting chemotaxis protein